MRSSAALRVTLLLIVTASAGAVTGQELLDIPLEQLGEIEITTAAKVAEPLAKTAATVSVVTAEDLRRMGARTIYDALERVPGFSAGMEQVGENFLAVRGVRTFASEKVLLLLDGHLLNDFRFGSATFQYLDSLPVENIARIEIVRGPGSALYGANAFLGVINIITKSAEEIGGVEAQASGEFEPAGTVARRYNVLAGGELHGDWRGNLNIHWLDAPGAELTVDADAFGRSGAADTQAESMDVQGSLSNGPFTLRSRYLRREGGDAFGILNVLNNASRRKVEYLFLDAEYGVKPAAGTDFNLRAYVDHQETQNYSLGLRAGSIPPSSPYFPWNGTGLIGNTVAKETITGAEARLDHRGIALHTLTAGLAWRRERLYDPRFEANFDPNPLPQVTDVSAYYNFIDPAARDIASLYVQDLWDVRPDVRATLGARYDRFSDFGSSFNPRAGLTWSVSSEVNARLTYGKAFRAPSAGEQYIKNNPVQLGNPDLDPEEITTWEAGLHWQRGRSQTGVTVFRSVMRNLIDTAASTIQYQNLGEARVRGVEWEGRYRFDGGAALMANYSYAGADHSGLEPEAKVPRHHLNFSSGVPLAAGLHWNLHAYWQSETPRSEGDTRADLAGFWRWNSALALKRGAWDFSAALFNLTDADGAYAAPADSIPGDFTLPGRSVVIGVMYAL